MKAFSTRVSHFSNIQKSLNFATELEGLKPTVEVSDRERSLVTKVSELQSMLTSLTEELTTEKLKYLQLVDISKILLEALSLHSIAGVEAMMLKGLRQPSKNNSVAVWGGASTLNQLMRYAHNEVKLIDFSPGEKYLVTYSSHEPTKPHDSHRVLHNIFDVGTGKVMRGFKESADEIAFGVIAGFTGVSWPVIRWGSVENVMDFYWSPTDPIFALFESEKGGGNQPARYVGTLREQLEQLAAERTPEGLPRVSKATLSDYAEKIEAIAASLASPESNDVVSLEPLTADTSDSVKITKAEEESINPSPGLRRRNKPLSSVENRGKTTVDASDTGPIKLDDEAHAHISKHRKLQEDLTDEMVELAQQLKESTLMMNQSIKNTEKILDSTEQAVEHSLASTGRANTQAVAIYSETSKTSCFTWLVMLLMTCQILVNCFAVWLIAVVLSITPDFRAN
ncbi:vesicle transport protein, Use1 [Tanacetum coccineum]